MKSQGGFVLVVTGCLAAAFSNGCNGAMPSLSSKPSATAGSERGSWMAPDAEKKNLLYVSDNSRVAVYSYPQRILVGTLRGFYLATGECVDARGNVFIVNSGTAKIFKYAHGATKRLATLQSPTRDPVGCAVDTTTGNLAVASEGFGSSATVAVFSDARGKPTIYEDSAFYQFYFCGYDDKGDLFADGLSAPGSGHFALAELRAGGASLTNIAINQYIRFPGGVEWDGRDLAVGDQFNNVYEVAVNKSSGVIVGTTKLGSGAENVKQFWIQGRTVIAPNTYLTRKLRSDVLFYNYPQGGKATNKITDGVKDAQGAVVSLTPKQHLLGLERSFQARRL